MTSDVAGSELLIVYRDYLLCLNERRWENLGDYVADELSYNDNRMTLADYRAMLEQDTRAIPDLQFHPGLLVADEHVVACRIDFRCTPRQAFLGFEPTGERIAFSEYVFYRFDRRRIVEVSSLIDRESIRRQITGSTPLRR